LDAQGAEGTETQAVTLDDFKAIQTQLAQVLARQEQQGRHNQGLESRLDKGLNRVAGQAAEAAATAAKLEREQTVANLLAKVEDPDQRALFQQMLTLSAPQAPVVLETPEAAPQAPAEQTQWESIFGMVRSLGADPNDKRIDYQVLLNETIPEQQRQDRFFASVRAAQAPVGRTPVTSEAPSPQTPPRSLGATGTGYRNESDVRGAYIEGKLPQDEYIKRMADFGVSV
jgi:hypothetical protein